MMNPTDLRGILRYVPQFRDKVFVIALDGVVLLGDSLSSVLMDVAVLRTLNIQVVLAHGVRGELERIAQEERVALSDLDGDGITDAATLAASVAASNRLTHRVLEGMATQDLKAACPNALTANPAGIRRGRDHLYTGNIDRVDEPTLQSLLGIGVTPVLPPVGFDGEGGTYRLNSDHVALSLARALRAVKVIFVTCVDGLDFGQGLIREIGVHALADTLKARGGEVAAPIRLKAEAACRACEAGVPRVHIINGLANEGLLSEVFSNEGVGTLVYGNDYQQIRPALKRDVGHIQRLIRDSVANEELIARSRVQIEARLSDYFLFEIDKNPVGCAALHVFPESKQGELACLCVSQSHENQGVGRRLMEYALRRAEDMGLREVLAVSTQAFAYFARKGGFEERSISDLPAARRELHGQSGRHARVLGRTLGS